MRWKVAIKIDDSDFELIEMVLEHLGCLLDFPPDDAEYMLHVYYPAFDECAEADEVWKVASQLFDQVQSAAEATGMQNLAFKRHAVLERQPNGSYAKRHYLSVSSIISIGQVESAKLKYSSKLSAEEVAELKQQEEQKKKRLTAEKVANYTKAALGSEPIALAIQIRAGELNPLKMGHIFDLAEGDLGREISRITSKGQQQRFARSVNHPDVFGIDSRHVRSSCEPPPKPMGLSEAQRYIKDLMDKWIELKLK